MAPVVRDCCIDMISDRADIGEDRSALDELVNNWPLLWLNWMLNLGACVVVVVVVLVEVVLVVVELNDEDPDPLPLSSFST